MLIWLDQSPSTQQREPFRPFLHNTYLDGFNGFASFVSLQIVFFVFSLFPLVLIHYNPSLPLNSIAYRRVIHVYQYEVDDDLSGRFFSPFSGSVCLLTTFSHFPAMPYPTLSHLHFGFLTCPWLGCVCVRARAVPPLLTVSALQLLKTRTYPLIIPKAACVHPYSERFRMCENFKIKL